MTKLIVCLAAVASPRGPAFAQHEEAVAPLMEQQWAREVVVVQPRTVRKQGALEIAAAVGVIPNDPFVVYLPLGLRLAYHLTEAWALEAGFSYNIQFDSGLQDALTGDAPVRDRQQLRSALSAVWSPLYGKMAAGRGHVVHFDAYLAAGVGIVRTEAEPTLELSAAVRPDFLLGVGLRVFLSRRWLMRVEYRQYLFLRPRTRAGEGGDAAFPAQLALCVGLLLGGSR